MTSESVDDACILVISDTGYLEIAANRAGWLELASWCAEMAEQPAPSGEGYDALGTARHVWWDFASEEMVSQRRLVARLPDEEDNREALHWVMFRRTDLAPDAFLRLRARMEDGSGTVE